MKNTKFTRIVVPLSTGCALMLTLSACMTVERAQPSKSEGSSPVSSISSSASSSASPESSSASPTTNPTEEKQKNEEQSHEKQIVGLTDDNKAGKPRPRAEQKSQSSLGKNVKLKDDGSWTVEEGSGQDKLSVVVNVDGTFHVKRGTGSDIYHEMTINADGSWERIEKVSSSQTKTRVNADGTWSVERKSDSSSPENVEAHADGTWKSSGYSNNKVITGNPDGTAVEKNTETGEEKSITRGAQSGVTTPREYMNSMYDMGLYIPQNGVIPLKPRTALPLGMPVKEAVPGTDEYKHATAELEGILLTDENKAGKPRPRSERKIDDDAIVSPNGAWTWQSKGSAIRVSEDGTWDQKDSAETGREGSSQLFADGSWESKMKMGDGENFVHVNPDGSWTSKDSFRTVEVKADGTWRTQTEYDTKYSTSDGKVFRESSGRKTELPSGEHEVSHIQVPHEPSLSYLEDGPGGGGVIPLKPRKPLQPGQQAVS